MFEHHRAPVLSFRQFLRRLAKSSMLAVVVVVVSLWLGAVGYHYTEGLSWLESTLNASMILTGMGPVDRLNTTSGKVFATFYSLFSGIVFLTAVAILFAPILHRAMHKFHVADD